MPVTFDVPFIVCQILCNEFEIFFQSYQLETRLKILFSFAGIFGMNLRSYLEEHVVC